MGNKDDPPPAGLTFCGLLVIFTTRLVLSRASFLFP